MATGQDFKLWKLQTHMYSFICSFIQQILNIYQNLLWDFPGGAVVKNPPANAGDTGSSPGPGRSHMLWRN